MTLAVDLPGDGCVTGADLIVPRGSRSTTSVLGDLAAHASTRINNHTVEQVRVVVGLVVNNGEDLSLDANLEVRIERVNRDDTVVAEDPVIEWSLILIDSAASTSGRMGPVDLIRLAHFHRFAVLEFVRSSEDGIVVVI